MVHPGSPDYPRPTSKAVTSVMKANKRTNTKPELGIRSRLHKLGLRFRKDFIIRIEGKAVRTDIVFTKYKLAIFIDGCFWHFCPAHGHIPKSNRNYWEAKLNANRERDEATSFLLINNGWNILRIWEHVSLEEAVADIVDRLNILKCSS